MKKDQSNLKNHSSSFRKLRTRTLIQLGGLIEKSGLLETLEIPLGADLQKDDDVKDAVTILLGLLVDSKTNLEDVSFKNLYLLKGQALFLEDFKKP